MDFNMIIQAIGSVGFPIVCCIYLIYTHKQSEEKHTQEVEKLRETVENNTKVMIQICTKLGVNIDEERN